MSRPLDDNEISGQLADLPGWIQEGQQLTLDLAAPDFLTGIRIVEEIAVEAESMNHHPDIDIRWRTLHVALSTHSAGGITQLDIELAHRISAIAKTHGAT